MPDGIVMKLTEPALRALVGTDPNLHLQISEQVMTNFVKKYVLRCVETSPVLQKLKTQLIEDARDEIRIQIGSVKTDWYNQIQKIELPIEYQTAISNSVRELIKKSIADAIAKAIAEIDTIVQRSVAVKVTDAVQKEVAYRVSEALKNFKV